MKKIKFNFICFSVIMGLILTTAPIQQVKAQASVSFQFFYDELSPYGNWVSYPQYGYAWVPAAGPGFRPYLTNGHWVFTDDGWMWASYYDWGWAPFHYGSWVMDPAFGWVWVPGYDWAPAWVTWGDYNGYYGWAPVQPGFSFSVGYNPPIDYWCFMHPRYMTAVNYGDHFYVAHNRRIALGSNTTVINNVTNITVVNNFTKRNNTSFNAGPRRVDFENTAKTKVQPVAIRETEKPGKMRDEGSTVTVFRPRIAKESLNAEKPRKISSADEVKRTHVEPGKTNVRKENVVNPAQPVKPVERKNPAQNMNGASQNPKPDIKPEKQIVEPKREVRPRVESRPGSEPVTPREKPDPREKQQQVPSPREQNHEMNAQPSNPNPVPAQHNTHQQPRQHQSPMNEGGNKRQLEQPQAPKPQTPPRNHEPGRK